MYSTRNYLFSNSIAFFRIHHIFRDEKSPKVNLLEDLLVATQKEQDSPSLPNSSQFASVHIENLVRQVTIHILMKSHEIQQKSNIKHDIYVVCKVSNSS